MTHWPLGLVAVLVLSLGGCGGEGTVTPPPDPTPTPTPAPTARVLITEVMYHPVKEEAFEDEHEFIELHNAGDADAQLEGWSFDQGIDYTFAVRTLAPGDTVVLAADPGSLFARYPEPGTVLGPYEGRLSNGGERIRLVDADGETVDSLRYDDEAPWPVGADALGASSRWLPPTSLPLQDHQGRGRSLQRVSFEGASDDPGNWRASELDAADPGSVATVLASSPQAVAVAITWNRGAPGPLTPEQPILLEVDMTGPEVTDLRAIVSAGGPLSEPSDELSYPLVDDGSGDDAFASDRRYTALLPAQPTGSVVRVRLLAERGDDTGDELISPRRHDPFDAHWSFVGTEPEGTLPYQLFVAPEAWTELWDVVQDDRVLDDEECTPNPGWSYRVPALFVRGREVTQVFVRYQGSRWNRSNGRNIPQWPAAGPERPAPLKVLSWSVLFPRYAPLDGMSSVSLNKLNQGCPGLNATVGFGLFADMGLPTPRTRFVRLFINGAYYSYMLQIERPGEEMLGRWVDERADANPDAPPEPAAPHLFKSSGCTCDEGPWGWGDERPLEDHCGFSAEERYAWTYERKSWDWLDHGELIALIEDLDVARAGTEPELRAFLDARFDVDLVLDYLVVMNWSVPFDDMFQNHYLAQRQSDSRWFLAPWDLDNNFGGWKGANSSIYIGEEGDADNRGGRWNRVKDAFLTVYRPEFDARLLAATQGLLSPESIDARVNAVVDSWDLAEITASPAGTACDFMGEAAAFRAFAEARQSAVPERVGE
ncbi:MAG: CotH kinase family protein [Deltaproteobacteria bacterium]|nr:CotH kinase family protein [Deltaproteobacteria bacterium]